ncbi:MAG: type II secretion system protein [Limisphaerales bacterium]
MKISKHNRKRAFTFAEVLAAMFFMGLVIPVAMQAIKISSDAGSMAKRKSVAVQLGDALLQELAITDTWRSGNQSGQFEAPYENYQWQIRNETWHQQGMTQLSLKVEYKVRERAHTIVLTTLVPEEEATE